MFELAHVVAQRSAALRQRRTRACQRQHRRDLRRQVGHRDAPVLGQDGRALQHVFKFAHVAGPVVGVQDFFCVGVDHEPADDAKALGAMRQQEAQQRRNVFAPFTQRWHVDAEATQAEVQILAKTPRTRHFAQVAVGGSDDAHVDLAHLLAAQRPDFLGFEHMQQLDLQRQRQLADFVEKDRAFVGFEKQALAGAVGAGEGALGVAEELALQQVLGYGAAVDRDESSVGAQALLVDRTRDHALAGAAFATDQHRAVGRCHLGDQAVEHPHQRRHRGARVVAPADDQLAQRFVLAAQAAHVGNLHQALRQFVRAHRLDHVVEGAGLHGLDRGVHRRVGRHHDEGGVDPGSARIAHHLDAGQVGHVDVAQGHLHIALGQPQQRLAAAAGHFDRVAGAGHAGGEDLADGRLVVDDEDLQ